MFFNRSKRNTKLPSKSALSFSKTGQAARMLCLGMSGLMSYTAYAQTPTDIDAARRQSDIIQRQDQERLQRQQDKILRRGEDVKGMDTKSLEPKITVPDVGTKCHDISEIVINNAPHMPTKARKVISDEFAGRCLNSTDFERVLSEVTEYYMLNGYITTRAYLAPQDLNTGRLEILVVEGKVENVVVDGNARSVSVANVFPGVEGNVLNLRDLEQGIDQLNRLPSNNARLDIEPGDQAGTSDILVHNKPTSPYHFSGSYDNQGYVLTGDKQVGVSVSTDDLLGFDEMFFVSHRQAVPGDIDYKYSQSDSLLFTIPYGYSTFSMSTSRSKYVQSINLPSGISLAASGDVTTHNATLDRVVFRDQSTRVSVTATITTKKSNNYLNDQFLDSSSRTLTVLDLDSNVVTEFAGGILSADLGYDKGLSILGALKNPDDLPTALPHAQFGKFKYGISYARGFKLLEKDFSFSSRFVGQKSRDVLFGSEQMSIGGLYSVRGFVLNNLAGDDGYYWRNEVSLRHPMMVGKDNANSRFYIGYDIGAVRNSDGTIPQGQLSGMVIGASLTVGGATFDLFNTRALTLPTFMAKESNQTWFRITYAI